MNHIHGKVFLVALIISDMAQMYYITRVLKTVIKNIRNTSATPQHRAYRDILYTIL